MHLVSPHLPTNREPAVTRQRHSVVIHLRCVLLAAGLVACGGGGSSRDTYTRATDVQGACCEHLAGDARTQCLQHVIRIDDPGVAKSSFNQQTYACVIDHFTCDPASGKPTQQSAQAQLECIQELDVASETREAAR
jgi:hypothetical protein